MVRNLVHGLALVCVLTSAALALPLDGNGWSVVTPSADTQFVYVSSSTGNDANDGLSESTAKATLADAYGVLRDGFPDYLLLKKGDTWTNESFSWSWQKSGRSESERMVIGSYGTGARPRVLPATGADAWMTNHGRKHLAIIGIEFYAHTRDPASPAFVSNAQCQVGFFDFEFDGQNWLLEDCLVRFCQVNIQNQNVAGPISPMLNVEIRRNIIVDNYSAGGHAQGLYISGCDGILVEENVFDHNGWYNSRDDASPHGATVFNHNAYIDNENPYDTVGGEPVNPADQRLKVIVRNNISTRASSHGFQVRTGGTITGNLIARCPIAILHGGGNDYSTHQPDGVDGDVTGNVVLEANDLNTSNPRGMLYDLENSRNVLLQNNLGIHALALGVNAKGIMFEFFGPAGAVTLDGNTFYQQPRGAPTFMNPDPGIIASEVNNNWWNAAASGYSGAGWPVTGSNRESETLTFVDATRTLATYDALLGGPGTFENFIQQCRAQSKDNWNQDYTAANAIAYLGPGYDEVSSNPTTSGNVLPNDTDADGDTLTVYSVNGQTANVGQQITGTHGHCVINGDGTWSYEFTGTRTTAQQSDVFQYQCTDGQEPSNTTDVTISIAPLPNTAPVANPDNGNL